MFNVLDKLAKTTITGAVAAGDVVTGGAISGLSTGDPLKAIKKTGDNIEDLINGDFE